MSEVIPTSGITQDTPKNIVLGAGTIHKGLKFSGGSWNFMESLLCATSGGSTLEIKPDILDLDIDGATVKFKGGSVKVGETATLKVNAVEITPELLKQSIFAKEAADSNTTGYTELVSKAQIEDGDYFENLAYVGKRINGEPIIIIFDNALCTSGLSLEGKNKEMSVPEITFECYADTDQADKNVLPYHIFYPTKE